VVATAAADCFPGQEKPFRFWLLSALCSILPDFDVFSFLLGIPYRHPLGHRGFSHSLAFALVAGLIVASLAPIKGPRFSLPWWRLACYFFLVTASHGLLDALTNGGLGVAFFAPFDNTRYFLPWRPIEVSPIGMDFFGPEGVVVIRSELKWIWLPSALSVFVTRMYRRISGPNR
jgi:inner membrane protein